MWQKLWIINLIYNSPLFFCLSSEDHHDGEQHDVTVRLRIPRAGEDRLWGVRCRVQVREEDRWLHLRHQEIKETPGRISGRVS